VSRFLLCAAGIFSLVLSEAQAAGFIDHLNGVPYVWKGPINYRVDAGDLSPALPTPTPIATPTTFIGHDTATADVDAAFLRWHNVPIANITATNLGPILDAQGTPVPDVNSTNYEQFVVKDPSGAPRNVTDQTVVVFDADGKILDDLLGGAGAGSGVLGIGSAGKFDDATHAIVAGLAIMNGVGMTENELKFTLTHELGHLMNMAHTQLNWQLEGGDSADDDKIPIMYPVLPSNAGTSESLLAPRPDDEFSLAFLYPNTAALSARGSLSGKILRRNGDAVRGVYVTCRNRANPLVDAVSWISDQILTGNGEYLCGNLNTADYTVSIEPIFKAINIFSPDPPYIVSESYSGASESWDPTVDISPLAGTEVVTPVSVTAGSATPDINIVLNEDGRLLSGQTVTGISRNSLPDQYMDGIPQLEYFITVPSGVKTALFELRTDSTADLDLLGRCDGEFSLPYNKASTGTAAPLVDSSGGPQQAEFAATSFAGNETAQLTAGSIPRLKNCTYHLLVVNNNAGTMKDVTWTLKATLSGGEPLMLIEDLATSNEGGGTGETQMLLQKFTAQDESITWSGITYTDAGAKDFGLVTEARLYEDTDGNGSFGSGDRLVAAASDIDTAARKIRFTGAGEFLEVGTSRTYIVTYNFGSRAAGFGPALLLLALGILVGGRRKRYAALCMLVLVPMFLSCAKGPEYRPQVANRGDVTLHGMTYGEQVGVRIIGTYDSVKDFFNK
jgi:hypothetical protein